MLNVFQREAVVDVCCVVTRYFGGVLLGAGGLVRAYTQSAKEALDAAGISVVRRWVDVAVPCPYALFERVKLEVESAGGVPGEIEYGAEVLLHALEEKGIYVSSGSACSSNHPAISGTLKAIGVKKELLDSTLRFSFGLFNTKEEIDYCMEALEGLLPVLRKYHRG